MVYEINPVLDDVAKWALDGEQEKQAFTPPPMDPAMMGGAPPMGPPPGAPGAGGSKKIDPAFIYMELSRVRKLLTTLFQNMDMKLPGDILDDSSVAQVMSGQIPSSNPIGQEPAPPVDPSLPGIGGAGPVGPVEAPKTASIKDLFVAADPTFNHSSDMADALIRLSHNSKRKRA